MVLEAMSQPLKEAELSQIAQLQVICECIPESPFTAGLLIAETNSGVLSHTDC